MRKKIISYLCIVIGMLVLSYAFVPQVLSGKIVNQSDISGWQGMSHEMMEWNAAHPDDQTAWTQSMFGGMPTSTIHASTKGDWTQAIYDFLLTGRRPATYLFISLLGAWLLLLAFGINPLIAFGGAIAVTFCAYNLQIIQVGHNTKMQAIAFLPWVLAALIYCYRSIYKEDKWWVKTILGSALFALALSFQVKANHPQITYYLAIIILLFALVELIWILKNSQRRKAYIKRFFIASSLLLVLGCAGIATNAIKLLPTYEYTPYSMRGGSSSTDDGTKERKGLDLDYATAWSYGWEELPNLLIPNFNGGSSAGAVNPEKSETYKLLKAAGQPNLKEVSQNLPLYWGPQPFTAGPMYMGAVSIFLFILALMVYKGREKWWLVIASILAVFLALGSNFIWFTKLFYNFAPLYNKFRTVSMALIVLQFTLPVLAFITLDGIVKEGASQGLKRKILISAAVSGGFCLICAFFTGIAGSFSGSVDAGQPDVLVQALVADRIYLLRSDALRSFALIIAAAIFLLWGCSIPKSAPKTAASQSWLMANRKRTAAVCVCVLAVLDMLPVAHRYLNDNDFITPSKFKDQFALRTVDKIILEDTDPSYRVLDLTVNIFNDSHPSYWHKNIGGYSPAKLQRYQEFIDNQLNSEINSIYKAISSASTVAQAEEALPYLEGLSQMNCRYIIVGEDTPPLRYKYAAGNAWFTSPSEGDWVQMSSYAPNCQEYKYSSEQGGKLVFSEVYYPVGWTLSVDDGAEQLDIQLEGKLLRSATVPAGEHSLVMRFDPPSYRIGEKVSRLSSIFVILVVLSAAALSFFQKGKR